MITIYKIINKINNKIYIGSAINFEKRKNTHVSLLNKNKHHSNHLQNAWNKHGESNFEFKIIEIIYDKTELLKREQYFLDTLLFAREYINGNDRRFLEFGYNICPLAGSRLGTKSSDESKSKMSKAKEGLYIGDKNPFFNKRHTAKTKHQIGLKNKQKYDLKSEKFKNWNRVSNSGKQHSMSKPILLFDLSGKFLNEFESINQAAKILNIKAERISMVLNNHRNSHKGFVWKFKKI